MLLLLQGTSTRGPRGVEILPSPIEAHPRNTRSRGSRLDRTHVQSSHPSRSRRTLFGALETHCGQQYRPFRAVLDDYLPASSLSLCVLTLAV